MALQWTCHGSSVAISRSETKSVFLAGEWDIGLNEPKNMQGIAIFFSVIVSHRWVFASGAHVVGSAISSDKTMSFQTEELGKGAATAGRLLKRAPFSISFSLPSLPGVAIVMGIGHGQHEQLKGQDKLSVFRQRTWKRTTPYWSV